MLDESERRHLEQLKRGRRVSVRLAERAAIVLHAAHGLENQQIGVLMGISRQKAGRWRDRYAAYGLAGIEKDAPRPGRKRRIDDAQRAAVVRQTLTQTPEGHTHWSRSTMATATGHSASTIGRIWREYGIKPHNLPSRAHDSWGIPRRSSCRTIRSSWGTPLVNDHAKSCRRRNGAEYWK